MTFHESTNMRLPVWDGDSLYALYNFIFGGLPSLADSSEGAPISTGILLAWK